VAIAHPDEGSSVNATNTHATPTLSNAERTVIEKILEASPDQHRGGRAVRADLLANERAEETF